MGWTKTYEKTKKDVGMKIGFWNKGGALQPLHEKINEIEDIIKSNQFCVFGVVEANFFSINNIEDVKISGFSILWDLGRSNTMRQNSRCVLFIRDDLSFKSRKDLMKDSIPEIWVEVGETHKKRTLICLFYREFSE